MPLIHQAFILQGSVDSGTVQAINNLLLNGGRVTAFEVDAGGLVVRVAEAGS